MDNNCRKCYFFKNTNVGGKMYKWCFNTAQNGLIRDTDIANHCSYYDDLNSYYGLSPDLLGRNKKQQRSNKIKNKCQIFRFHYSIRDQVAIIISRFSHWKIILSGGKEHLFHQNIVNMYEYQNMQLFEQPGFHLHEVIENSPMAIQKNFEIIEEHDIYILKNRYHKSIASEKFEAMDFGTPHLNKNNS